MKDNFVPNKPHKSKIVWSGLALTIITVLIQLNLVTNDQVNQALKVLQAILPLVIMILRFKFNVSQEAIQALQELSKKRIK